MSDDHTNEKTDLVENDDEVEVQIEPIVKRYITVEPCLVLMFLYVGAVGSITQQYVYQRLGYNNNISVENENSSKLCLNGNLSNMTDYKMMNEIQKEASYLLASFKAVGLLPMLFSAVMLGSYSDRIGRKIILVLPIIGACVMMAVSALVIFLHLNMYYFYAGIIVEGFLGGSVLFICGAFSYISDITTKQERAFRVIVLELANAVGFVLSQLGVGYLIQYQGFLLPVLIVLGCNIINLVYVVFVVQESLHRPNRGQVKFWTSENYKRVVMLYTKDTTDRRRWKLQASLLLLFIVLFCGWGVADITALFVLASPYCFTSVMLGYFVAWNTLIPGICGTAFTKLLHNLLSEMTFFMISGVSAMVNCVMTALVSNTIWLFVAAGINMFGKLQVGMLRSFTSKLVERTERGALFSSIAWIEQAGMVIGSVSLDFIYAATVGIFPGFVFFVLAGIFLLSVVIAGIVSGKEFIRKRKQCQMEEIIAAEESIAGEENPGIL